MLVSLGRLARYLEADTTSQAVLRRLDDALVYADSFVKDECRQLLEATDRVEFPPGGHEALLLRQRHVTALSGVSPDDGAVEFGVWVDSDRAFGPSTKLVLDTDYYLEPSDDGDDVGNGILRLLRPAGGFGSWGWDGGDWRGGGGLCWPRCPRTIRVGYRCWYEEDEIPDDLAGAVVTIAAAYYAEQVTTQQTVASGGAVKSIKSGDGQITYLTPAESSISSSTKSKMSQAGGDPYGVNAVLDKYREIAFG